jgi:hypothetical protein
MRDRDKDITLAEIVTQKQKMEETILKAIREFEELTGGLAGKDVRIIRSKTMSSDFNKVIHVSVSIDIF